MIAVTGNMRGRGMSATGYRSTHSGGGGWGGGGAVKIIRNVYIAEMDPDATFN